MKIEANPILTAVLAGWLANSAAAAPHIEVLTDQTTHRLSPYLTGACIEDVNHEIYGGIDSQLIFGESFGEPAPQPGLEGFQVYGGRWLPRGDVLWAEGGTGPKLVSGMPPFSEGKVEVDIQFEDNGPGNAGLILKVTEPGTGADRFNGYEVAIEPAGTLVLGRHRQNWEPLRRIPCSVPTGEWVKLTVNLRRNAMEILLNGEPLLNYQDSEHPLESGTVGLRTWQRTAAFRNLSITTGGARHELAFERERSCWTGEVSAMWRPFVQGTASVSYALNSDKPFSGRQSQQITFSEGHGTVGIENQGLNRWGMNLEKNKRYEGYVYVRSANPAEFYVALESADGKQTYAEQALKVSEPDWQRLDFLLWPGASDVHGRFAIKLKRPGSLCVGYAFLQPGAWGRFKALPVRRDVARGLIHQGITVLRQGGCMVNAQEYRWKKMIGPRALRPPYNGFWYPHSSNGWGIFDFLNFCEAAGFLAIPAVNVNETPEDMADFIEYANGRPETEWGGKRAADGHRQPYRLRHLQIGNEEKVDEKYWQKFKAIAEAIWARDQDIILVVGDFAYDTRVDDPFNFKGNPAGLTTLAAHEKILELAKAHGREVWFDVHINTDGPKPSLGGTFSYLQALEGLAAGARFRVVIFEFNAGNHSQRRALANAAAVSIIERDGRIPIATSANCLQPDGQNDNGWDQGLLFLNPSQTWLQPPGYVTRMISRNYAPLHVPTRVSEAEDHLEVSAKRTEDGKILILNVVNFHAEEQQTWVDLQGFTPTRRVATIEQLSAPLDAVNTADAPERVKPRTFDWFHRASDGKVTYRFPPHSFTVMRFE